MIEPHPALIFQHANTFFLCYAAVKLMILLLYNTVQHVHKPLWASWNVNSPVPEVKGILEVVTTVTLSCDGVTDEAVVDPIVWLVLVGRVVEVTGTEVLVGWLVVRWVVLVETPGKFSICGITQTHIKIINCILTEQDRFILPKENGRVTMKMPVHGYPGWLTDFPPGAFPLEKPNLTSAAQGLKKRT